MALHTRMHIEDPDKLLDDGTCLICKFPEEHEGQVGRLLDLSELLDQARDEVKAPVRDLLREFDAARNSGQLDAWLELWLSHLEEVAR